MHIKKYIQFFGMLSAVFLTTSCNEEMTKEGIGSTLTRTVKADIGTFRIDGRNATLPEENQIDDLQACLFENGTLTEIYTEFGKENDQYVLQINQKTGHLYMLANTADRIDLQEIKARGLSEEEWLKTTLSSTEGKAHATDFFSGMLDLSETTEGTLPMTLKRGVARFDLSIRTLKSVQVEQVVLKNMIKQSYIFQQNPVSAPENETVQDIITDFPQALETSTEGIAYVYEQSGTNLKVCIKMKVEGQSRTVEANLPAILKRNTVYTLNIGTDPVTTDVKLSVIEWENGGDHTLASEAGSLKVDTKASDLPGTVTVTADKNRVILPYMATELTLAVDCDDELEFIPDEMPLTVETLGGTSQETRGKNLFRIQKERWRLGVPGKEIKLRFHRKGLNQTYPDDYLTLVLSDNPTKIEGLIQYNDSYVYDFGRYIDNELGILTLPESKKLTVEYESGEDHWIKLAERPETANSFRVLGGWKPNDQTANGREQKAKLVICNIDGSEREEYTVIRRNWGLPVTYLNGVWWCKYNAMGDSKNFNDQILSSNDPAAKEGKSLFDYLRDCTAEEFFNLWKWQYQGKTTQGMQVIDDNGVAKMEGYGTSTVHINKLAPTAMAPDGYELPSMENFERVLNSTSGYIWMMWDGGHTTAWNGGSNIQRRQRRRNDITVGTVAMTDLIYIQMYNQAESQYEPLVWYGPGAQWDANGIKHAHYNSMLWATYSPDNGQGWYFVGAMNAYYPAKNGAGSSDTRILRFKKSDVEYIYQ